MENYYSLDDDFGLQDDFMLAAALTAYDGSPEPITDLSIGRLRFIKKRFGRGISRVEFEDIETSFCNRTELLEGSLTPTSNFFELAEIIKEDSQLYGPKMLCASDPADLSIYGNYDSEKASNLMIVFEKCDASWSSVPCKS